ncbi:MAG: hypothetical protein KJ592_00635 [Nanoarchaeota archaeon]|nr:hypothetical protein [Nanoarchaeota archaeon]
MIKSDFLSKLKRAKTLLLVESSEEISVAYLIKSDKCIRVAKLAYGAGIYENAIGEAYYSIYNSLMSLFYRCGIKCENHTASGILLGELFGLVELCEIFTEFKKDRIDNQYYLPVADGEPVDGEKCGKKIRIAQRFNLELRAYVSRITLEEIGDVRERFEEIDGSKNL